MAAQSRNDEGLSPRLEEVIEQIIDRDFAERLRTVYLAAASAIEQLSALNLVRYERKTALEDGPADLALWEEMAPAVRDTVIAVNGLLSVIRGEFPAKESGGSDRELPASMDVRLAQEVESVLHRTADNLGKDIAQVRDKVLRPEVVSDRWALLTELQNVRRDLRTQIGNLVYLTAAAFGEVDRDEVVPGHQAEVESAAQLRSTTAELRRALDGRLQKMTDDSTAVATAKQIDGDLDMFIRMPAYLSLKVPEKRQVAQLRAQFQRAAAEPDLSAQQVRDMAATVLDLLRFFAEMATREVLTTHDREVWVKCGHALEQARLHLTLGSKGARRAVEQAVKAASALHGVNPDFDNFMRKLRNARITSMSNEDLRREIFSFDEHLARLPFH